MTVEPVHIASSDPTWSSLFAEERARVLEAMGRWVEEVEHVGSTGVPGLDAKPVVDLMAGLRSMDDAGACVGPLVGLGYSYWAEGHR